MANKVFIRLGAWYVASAKALSTDLEITSIIDDPALDHPTVDGGTTLSSNFANDAAAATGGIPVGGMYHNAGAVRIRLT